MIEIGKNILIFVFSAANSYIMVIRSSVLFFQSLWQNYEDATLERLWFSLEYQKVLTKA